MVVMDRSPPDSDFMSVTGEPPLTPTLKMSRSFWKSTWSGPPGRVRLEDGATVASSMHSTIANILLHEFCMLGNLKVSICYTDSTYVNQPQESRLVLHRVVVVGGAGWGVTQAHTVLH